MISILREHGVVRAKSKIFFAVYQPTGSIDFGGWQMFGMDPWPE